MANVRRPWERLWSWWRMRTTNGTAASDGPRDPSVDELLRQAQRELEAARAYFDNVSDPDLVDHACYLLEAAQRRYSYLLRMARQGRVAG